MARSPHFIRTNPARPALGDHERLAGPHITRRGCSRRDGETATEGHHPHERTKHFPPRDHRPQYAFCLPWIRLASNPWPALSTQVMPLGSSDSGIVQVTDPALIVFPKPTNSPKPLGSAAPDSIFPGLPVSRRKVVAIEATVQKAPVEVIAQETFPLGAWKDRSSSGSSPSDGDGAAFTSCGTLSVRCRAARFRPRTSSSSSSTRARSRPARSPSSRACSSWAEEGESGEELPHPGIAKQSRSSDTTPDSAVPLILPIFPFTERPVERTVSL